jgi:hypothetical protein
MENPLYKIVHLGTQDSNTGFTEIARGLKEVIDNDADIVYIQSSEISELFAKTREIMGLLVRPDIMASDYQYSHDAHDNLAIHINEIFNDAIIKKTIPVHGFDAGVLNKENQDLLKAIFSKLASLLPDGFDLQFADTFMRKEESTLMHSHYNYHEIADIWGQGYKRDRLSTISAEILLVVAENPESTTRIATDISQINNNTVSENKNLVPEVQKKIPCESAPPNAIIIMRNEVGKEAPWHGPPVDSGKRLTCGLTAGPSI